MGADRMNTVFVLGSINTDLVISAPRMPLIGESLKGSGFLCSQGGKGANQAVACKKLGCESVVFIGAVGRDRFGDDLLESLRSHGVDTACVARLEGSGSGACVIILDERTHDNLLIVDPGANEGVDRATLQTCLDRGRAGDLFVTQLEVNLDAVELGLALAKKKGMFTVLNPAPVTPVPEEIYKNTDLLVLNETEALLLAGVDVADSVKAGACADFFRDRGVGEVLITLGSRGCFYCNGREVVPCPAEKATAVDPTSAGDTFIGALVSKKARGEPIADALTFASAAAAIAVSRKGALASIPTLQEVTAYFCK